MILSPIRSWILEHHWRFLFLVLALYCLTGCLGHSSRETGAVSGVVAGQPVAITWRRDSEGHTTLEIPPALINAATAAANSTPWGALITGGVSLALAAVAGHQRGVAAVQTQRADEHKADADEGWSEALKP
jgi:hypothetical protein